MDPDHRPHLTKMRKIMRKQIDFKTYAMRRMVLAIERTNAASSIPTKNRASRWVAAWGMIYHGLQSHGNASAGDFRSQQGVQNTKTWMSLVC